MLPSKTPQQPSQAAWNARVFAAIAGAAVLGILPLLIKGNVAAHDLQFHIASWNEVAQQWRGGTWWPRWAAGANYGFGEPRFIFYPPLSWLLGGFLALWLPVRALPAAFCFLAFASTGCGMFALARRYLSPYFAIGAAVLYALNPYHLITVYWDFRVAEMLASAIFPVAIAYALESRRDWRSTVPLAVAVAGVWLSNAPAAVMLMYSLVWLLIVLAILCRSFRPLLFGAVGILLGVGLAAFYIVPAAFEQGWVNILGIFGSGLTPKENFLFSVATDAPHTYFNFLVSGIALEEVALLIFAVFFAIRRARSADEQGRWRIALAIVGGAAALMMFKLSLPLWSLPKMQFVQFPWRWMLVVNLVLVLLGMTAIGPSRIKWVWALLIVTFLGVTVRDVIRQATWGRRAVAEMYWSTSPDGYRGAREYLPMDVHVSPKPYVLPQVPLATLECQLPCPQSELTIQRWSAEEKRFRVRTPVPATLNLKLFDHPAWKTEVDGEPTQHDAAYNGVIQLSIQPGAHDVHVVFERTSDRTFGIVIWLFAAAASLLLLYYSERASN